MSWSLVVMVTMVGRGNRMERERERMGSKPEEKGGSKGLETTGKRKGERRCQEGRWEKRERERIKDPPGRWESV